METDFKFPPSYFPGGVRVVYLVQDIDDETALIRTGYQVYTSFQNAYDAANTLQVTLGGTNKVVIVVGNTTAATVGNVALSASWNIYVSIVGIGKQTSELGNITITGVFSCNPTIINAKVGNITAEGGISMTLNNSVVGNLVTSSTTGASGNISLSNCVNSSIGSITSSASLGNVGTLTFTSCANLSIGAVSLTQTSTTTSYSVGLVSMTYCSNITFSSTFVVTMAYVSSTGTIGGLSINNTNQNILFEGNFRMTAYANNTNTTSDVAITQITAVNTTFNGFYVNYRTIAGNTWEGGVINTLFIQKCFFRQRVRIAYHNSTAMTAGKTFKISDCIFKGSSDAIIQNTDISFDSFVIEDCQSNLTNFFNIQYNAYQLPTVPFMNDGFSMLINNLSFEIFGIALYNPTTANTVDDAKISECRINICSLFIDDGDINYNIINTSTTKEFFLVTEGVTLPTKRSLLIGCSLNHITGSLNFYNIPVTMKNTYFAYYTDILNPRTQDIIAYNSYIESVAEATSVTTWTGTIYSSVLRKLSTDDSSNVALYTSTIIDQEVRQITGAVTIDPQDQIIEITSGTFTQTLPAIGSIFGREIVFKNTGVGILTLDGLGAETIDGLATFTVLGGSSVRLKDNGTQWIVIA